VKVEKLENNGSKTRNRYHYGLIAQEVKSTMDKLNVDFGGYQDHNLEGNKLSIGYNELIAPIIKAIQELSNKNKELENRLKTVEHII